MDSRPMRPRHTWNDSCPPLSGITEAERDGNETFSLSQKAKESLLALAWRENEGKANLLLFYWYPKLYGTLME